MRHVHPRQQIEASIDHLIGLLDEIDDDTDREPEETDHDLAGATTDLEEDTSDDEPSLGWTMGMAQGRGRCAGFDDRELAAEPTVTDADRRAYFRRRHGNVGR